MMTQTWRRFINEAVYDKNIVVLAQQINDLGENVKVSVRPGLMTVKGIGRYDEKKQEFMEKNGFSCSEDYSCEDWRG